MARRPLPTSPLRASDLSPDELRKGIDRLGKRLAEVEAFDPASVREQFAIPHVKALSASIEDSLVRTFGANTLDLKRFESAARFDNGPFNFAYEVPIGEVHRSLSRSKDNSTALIRQSIELLKERLQEREGDDLTVSHVVSQQVIGRRVFVVHGHDDGARESVARFLEKIGFEPIILHEQANQGRTIIEKFQSYAAVGFAVVLLTPDDEGCESGGTPRPRARQNVVLELGYFVGRLGRERVLALLKGEVEVPSDFAGVVYERLDAGGAWRSSLGRELEAAGFEIDWNKVMRP